MTTVALGAGDQSPVTTSRFASRRAAMVMLARASPGLTCLMLGLGTLTGAMSAVFAVAIGAMVGAVPSAMRVGFNSPAGHRIVWALVAMGTVTLVEEGRTARRGGAAVWLPVGSW